jgi:OOP family OmpA-OmpF porin
VVEGHTDSDGDAASNLALSEARATSVLEAFVEAGVPADILTVRALGESRPVASNETPEGRARNRRVDILIR